MATLRIYKAPSGQWSGQLVEDGVDVAGIAGCASAEDVECEAQEAGLVYETAIYEDTNPDNPSDTSNQIYLD